MTTQEILQHFNGVEKRNINKWQCKCPTHDDKNASLSVEQASDGRTLLKCHAGCNTRDIVSAVGLNMSDLYTQPKQSPSKLVEEYTYTPTLKKSRLIDANGNKTFRWHSFVNNKWCSGTNKQKLPLYNQQILSSLKDNIVYVVEGEKDVNTLTKYNLPSVCSPHGATKGNDSGKKWLDSYTELFCGIDVIILQDNDDVGKSFANAIATKLLSKAKSVKVIDLTIAFPKIKEHGDISDVAAMYPNGQFLPQLQTLIDQTIFFTANDTMTSNISTESVKGKKLTNDVFKDVLSIMGITIKYNLVTSRMEVKGLPQNYSAQNSAELLPSIIKDFCIKHDIKLCSTDNIVGHINLVADENRYNPIHEMLEKPMQCKNGHIEQLYEMLGITDKTHQKLILKWLVQAVALSYNTIENPITSEFVLVFKGAQGIGKTSIFRQISVNPDWFVEGVTIDINNKDSIINATSGWITEIGELDSTLKKEQSALKAFLTKRKDEMRLPYGRTITVKPRTTCFCATVNNDTFLRDETGARRFVVIPLEKINKKTLYSLDSEWFADIWRDAYQIYLKNPKFYLLSDSEIESINQDNLDYRCYVPCEEELRDKLDFTIPTSMWNVMSATDIKEKLHLDRATSQQISTALKAIAKDYPHIEIIKKRDKHGSRFFVPLKQYDYSTLPFPASRTSVCR